MKKRGTINPHSIRKESQNSVEKAESDDFGGKPLVKNPIRPKGDNLTRIKKKKVTEGPDPRSKLGKIQHDQATAWVKKKNDEEAKKVGGHDKLRQIRSDELKAKLQKKKVTEATDEDRMRSAMEDEERIRKLKGKKPTPKALRRIPGTDKYVKEGAKQDYKKDDSDERAADTFDQAEPFEKRPHTNNSATTSDKHDFARDR